MPERALADSVIDAAIRPYFVLGALVTALAFLGIGYFISRKAVAAEQWPTTDGTVISTDVVKRVFKSQDGFDYFVPRIRYEYTTNGIRRHGDVIRIGLDEMGYLEEKKAASTSGSIRPARQFLSATIRRTQNRRYRRLGM